MLNEPSAPGGSYSDQATRIQLEKMNRDEQLQYLDGLMDSPTKFMNATNRYRMEWGNTDKYDKKPFRWYS